MIDLYTMAGSLTQAVNPLTKATLRRSTGPAIQPDFSTRPGYDDVPVIIDVQALAGTDLQQIQNINQQGEIRAVYLKGAAQALSRPLQIGGDIVLFEGAEWLITQVLEEWGADEWRKVIVTRQT